MNVERGIRGQKTIHMENAKGRITHLMCDIGPRIRDISSRLCQNALVIVAIQQGIFRLPAAVFTPTTLSARSTAA